MSFSLYLSFHSYKLKGNIRYSQEISSPGEQKWGSWKCIICKKQQNLKPDTNLWSLVQKYSLLLVLLFLISIKKQNTINQSIYMWKYLISLKVYRYNNSYVKVIISLFKNHYDASF